MRSFYLLLWSLLNKLGIWKLRFVVKEVNKDSMRIGFMSDTGKYADTEARRIAWRNNSSVKIYLCVPLYTVSGNGKSHLYIDPYPEELRLWKKKKAITQKSRMSRRINSAYARVDAERRRTAWCSY